MVRRRERPLLLVVKAGRIVGLRFSDLGAGRPVRSIPATHRTLASFALEG
jgi:hypothetical protein